MKKVKIMLKKHVWKMRKLMGLSQQELAQELGYKSYVTVSEWERGTKVVPSDKFDLLVKIFEEKGGNYKTLIEKP